MGSPLDYFVLVEEGNGQIRYAVEGSHLRFVGAEVVPRMDDRLVSHRFAHAISEIIAPPRKHHSYAPLRNAISAVVPPGEYERLFLDGLGLERPEPAFDPGSTAAVEIIEFLAPEQLWTELRRSHTDTGTFIRLKRHALTGEFPVDYFGFIGFERGKTPGSDSRFDFKRRPYRVSFEGRVHSQGVETTIALDQQLGDGRVHLTHIIDRILYSLNPAQLDIEQERARFQVPVTNPQGDSIALAAAEVEARLLERYPSVQGNTN